MGIMKSILILLSFSLLIATTGAHNSCDWHVANDLEPDFAHYDAHHDDDGDGSAGSVYEWTQAQYGSGGYLWYQLVLPAGEDWVAAI